MSFAKYFNTTVVIKPKPKKKAKKKRSLKWA